MHRDVETLRMLLQSHPQFARVLGDLHRARARWIAGEKERTALNALGLLVAAGAPPTPHKGHYWRRLEELERLLWPYTEWTTADLDRLVKHSNSRLRRLGRWLTTRRTVVAGQQHRTPTAEPAQNLSEAMIRQVAVSLAWQTAGSRASDADRRAAKECAISAPLEQSAVRNARHDWIERLAAGR